MSINYIGSGGLGQISNLKTAIGTQSADKSGEVDNVEFSSVLEGTRQASGTENTAATQRAQKVAAIREQVEAGSYQPDLEQVANSLANFLLDGE